MPAKGLVSDGEMEGLFKRLGFNAAMPAKGLVYGNEWIEEWEEAGFNAAMPAKGLVSKSKSEVIRLDGFNAAMPAKGLVFKNAQRKFKKYSVSMLLCLQRV